MCICVVLIFMLLFCTTYSFHQSGLNMQDVIISHDDGKVQLWTGEEVFTKYVILKIAFIRIRFCSTTFAY